MCRFLQIFSYGSIGKHVLDKARSSVYAWHRTAIYTCSWSSATSTQKLVGWQLLVVWNKHVLAMAQNSSLYWLAIFFSSSLQSKLLSWMVQGSFFHIFPIVIGKNTTPWIWSKPFDRALFQSIDAVTQRTLTATVLASERPRSEGDTGDGTCCVFKDLLSFSMDSYCISNCIWNA